MKNNLLRSTLALIALCSTLTLRANSGPAVSHRFASELPLTEVAARVQANGDTVTVGTTRVLVSLRLGSPNAVLRDGSWLYYGYNIQSGQANLEQAGTLVVRFNSGKVAGLTLADEATVVALRQERRPADKNQVLTASNGR